MTFCTCNYGDLKFFYLSDSSNCVEKDDPLIKRMVKLTKYIKECSLLAFSNHEWEDVDVYFELDKISFRVYNQQIKPPRIYIPLSYLIS